MFMGVEATKSQHMGTWCESTLGFNRQEEHSEAKYDCTAGYSNWRSGWSLDKKSWPGSPASVVGSLSFVAFLKAWWLFLYYFPRKTRTRNLYIEDIDVSFVGVLTQIQVGWGMARWHDESKNKIRLHGQKLVLFNLFGMRNNHVPSGKLT